MYRTLAEKMGFRDHAKVFNFFEPHSTDLLKVDNYRNAIFEGST